MLYSFVFCLVFLNIYFRIAFTNIYNLLTRGGACLLTFLGHMPVYDVYRTLARNAKWNYWLRDVERFVSPYHDCQVIKKN